MLPFTSVSLWNSIDLILSAAGREGARRTPFLIHEGPLRDAKNCFLVSAEGRRGAWRTAFFDPRRATKGREELLFCPRRARRDAENCFF